MVSIGDLLHGLRHRPCPGLNLVVFPSDSHLDVVMLAHRRHYGWHQSVLALILVAAVGAQWLHMRLCIVVLGHCLIHLAIFYIGTRPRGLIHRRALRVVIIIRTIVLLRSRGFLIESTEIGLGARLRHNRTTILLMIEAELPFLLHQELLMLLTKIYLCLLRCVEGVLTLLVLLVLLVGVRIHRRECRMMIRRQLRVLLCLMDKMNLLLRDHRVFLVLLHYLLFQLRQVWCLPSAIVLIPSSQARQMRLTDSRLSHLFSQ